VCLSGLGGCGTFERTVLCVFCWGFTLLVYQNSRTDACSASERGCSCVGTVPFVMCGAASCINPRHSSICEGVCFSSCWSLSHLSLALLVATLIVRSSFATRSTLYRHSVRFSFFVSSLRSCLVFPFLSDPLSFLFVVRNYIFLLLFS
jgi:hypothetical protein